MPRIICAKCRKPVDRFEWMRSFGDRSIKIYAYCHGEVDSMEIPESELVDTSRGFVQLEEAEGIAFQQKLER